MLSNRGVKHNMDTQCGLKWLSIQIDILLHCNLTAMVVYGPSCIYDTKAGPMTDKVWLADRCGCSSFDETFDCDMASTYIFKTFGVIPGCLPGIFDHFLALCECIGSC